MSRDAAMALLDGLHQQGITIVLRKGRLGFLPGTLYKTITDQRRFEIYEHRDAIKALLREGYRPARVVEPLAAPVASGQPQGRQASPLPAPLLPAQAAPQASQGPLPGTPTPRQPRPAVQPEPEVYAYHHRVTDRDVRKAMQMMGDEILDAYITGRLSKREAYEMTRIGLMHVMEMPS